MKRSILQQLRLRKSLSRRISSSHHWSPAAKRNSPGATLSNVDPYPRQPMARQFSTVFRDNARPSRIDPRSMICRARSGSSEARSTSITACFTSPLRGLTTIGVAGEHSDSASSLRLAASRRSSFRATSGFESAPVARISTYLSGRVQTHIVYVKVSRAWLPDTHVQS